MIYSTEFHFEKILKFNFLSLKSYLKTFVVVAKMKPTVDQKTMNDLTDHAMRQKQTNLTLLPIQVL